MQRARERRAARRSGFTLIEVVISLGIMMIGAMGIIALQQHTIRSNGHARQLTIATQIAQRWIERLKQDGHTWIAADAPAIALAGTRHLRGILGAPANQFITIPNSNGFVWDQDGSGDPLPTGSRAFDYRGDDIVLGAALDRPIFYCAAFRPAWVYTQFAMRVDVRVWWPRPGFDTQAEFGLCDTNLASLDPGGPADSMFNQNGFHVVYLSTVIRPQPLKR